LKQIVLKQQEILKMSESTESKGQICWLPTEGSDRKILYWRSSPRSKWQPYHTHPLRQPDLEIPGASKGFTTAQRLMKMNYQYVSCENVVSEKPQPGSRYSHHKGEVYEVWTIAHTESGSEYVIYSKVGSPFKFESRRSYVVSDTENLQHYLVDIFDKVMQPIPPGSTEAIAWARPLSSWMEPVEVDGKMRDRFLLIQSSATPL
jgi:hypothetical protein